MAKTFTAQVDEIVTKTNKRMEALIRMSVQDVIDEAQTPVGKGGKMRVDTGFLRASGQLSFDGMPTGPVRGDKTAPNSYPSPDKYSSTATVLQLANFKVGMSVYFGWTANYAKYREAYDGFLVSAVAKWQEIVSKNAAAIMARIK